MPRYIRLIAWLAVWPMAAALGQGPDLDALIAEYERLERRADPVTSAQQGDIEALARLPDVTPAAARARRDALAELRARLSRIDANSLSGEDSLNRAFMLRQLDDQIASLDFDEARSPFVNDSGFHTLAGYLAETTPVRTAADAEAWLARLAALPDYYAANVANLRRGMGSGFTQPRLVVEPVLEAARAQAAVAAEQSPLLAPFDLSDEHEARARALGIVRDRIKPAQRELVRFLANEYLAAARPSLAVRSVPEGEAYYRYLVGLHTTTAMTPDEIHTLGSSEVARIRAAMDEIVEELGFAGTFGEFQEFLRTDPQFYAASATDLLEKAAEIAKRADDRLPSLFGLLPRLTYGVRAVPAAIAEGYTTGRYWPGSPALGVAGGYMVNTHRLDQRPLYELPALTLHEAVPGHHIQIALTQELEDLPYFRRTASITAFVEGWGLYAETLGEEMGIYRTPYERFGRLSYEMWRACRLVADTGIHWLGWSVGEARRCFDENTALAPHNITTELRRYVAWPGQALAYKIGELTIRRLRAEAESALGERFDLRAFHDELLGAGALPMDVLEQRMRAWIAAAR